MFENCTDIEPAEEPSTRPAIDFASLGKE